MSFVVTVGGYVRRFIRRKRPAHLLVDGDQLPESFLINAMEALDAAGYEPVSPIKVFCNNYSAWQWKDCRHKYDIIQVGEGKDIADTHIILECGMILATSKLKTIAVLSGDGIFAANAAAIKNNGGFPILLAPAFKTNVSLYVQSPALCIMIDDSEEGHSNKPSTTETSHKAALKKIKKNSGTWHRRNRVINHLKEEALPMSMEYLEEVADKHCAHKPGEQTILQMLRNHPEVILFEKAGIQYAVHKTHENALNGNVVSISQH